ncbi:MAG: hypothetical protein ACSHYA_06535 [Opitutaceae bacterium]
MKTKRSPKSGFALVIALSLMSFILLLLLSITTLVQVETVNASVTKKQLEARMNAQLGAMIALGDLQKLTGPDQRVTARSDITVAPDSTPEIGTAHWTGVWSSKSSANDSVDALVNLDQRKPQWLVSGDLSRLLDRDDNSIVAAPSGDQMIKLAGVNKSVVLNQEEVIVLKDPILDRNNGVVGEFAYWVSDEGVKARVNLDNPHSDPGSTPDAAYFNLASAQQGDATVARDSDGQQPYFTAGLSLWKDADANVSKVLDASSIPLIGASGDSSQVSRAFFHDFSAVSKSVLSNLKEGGLKQDLSVALTDPVSNGLSGSIFPSVSGATASLTDPGGPKWEQLADYYQLAESSDQGEVNFRKPTNDQVGITPVVTRYNFVIHVFAERFRDLNPRVDVAENYRYRLGIFPLITLWNPYDEDLVIPDLGLQTDMRGVFLVDDRDVGIPGGVNGVQWLRDSDHRILDVLDQWGVIPHPSDQNRGMMGFTIKGTTIPAGRAINFAPPLNSTVDFTNASQNVLVPGASAEFVNGFFTSPVDFGLTPETPYTNFRDGSDRVKVCMAPFANIDTHITNLYAESFTDSPDREERYMFFSSLGMGFYFRDHDWHSPQVIPIEDMGVSDFSFISGVGSSVSASYNDTSPIDLVSIRTEGHAIVGTARTMRFAKNEGRDSDEVHLLSQMNPRAQIFQDQMHVRVQQQGSFGARNYMARLHALEETAWWESAASIPDNFIGGADDVYSYVGLGNTAIHGDDQSILFETPNRVPLGIGQLMHANLSKIGELSYNLNSQNWYSNLQQPHTAPAYAIGNSVASIHLPLGSTKEVVDGSSPMFDQDVGSYFKSDWLGAHYDYSYELNDALWDDFFMSTILPDNVESVEFPLPNSRMIRWNGDPSEPEPDWTNSTQTAEHLMLEGGFNVNSTSVAAWASVLGALRDVPTLGESSADSELRHNFSRFSSPDVKSTELIPEYGQSEELVAGFRSLSDDQILDLAESIVDEIKTRRSASKHPFLSLSQFVNRSIDSEDIDSTTRRRFAYMGPLQFAIDQSAVNGDPAVSSSWESQPGNGLWDDEYIFTVPDTVSPFLSESLEAIRSRPFMDAAPGSLTQADILAKIGAILTARSDTFTIRSYGSANSSISGDSQSAAYYEMTVQRMPEYHDAADLNHVPANSELNKRFGRRYQIVSTRWLSADEI